MNLSHFILLGDPGRYSCCRVNSLIFHLFQQFHIHVLVGFPLERRNMPQADDMLG